MAENFLDPVPSMGHRSPYVTAEAVTDRQQLSERVASRLREKIIAGDLSPGDFLRIDAIAKDMNISTTPVREGLLLLQSQSFVRLKPRRGFLVNSFSERDLRDLFWMQASIGAELARRAAGKIQLAELELLQSLHQRYEQAIAQAHFSLAVRLGHQFHRTINLAARSPRMALLLGSLTKQLSNQFYASFDGQLDNSLAYHPLILEALVQGDADQVQALMFAHINQGAEPLVGALSQAGRWGAFNERASSQV